jgi:hypothetical protein
MVGIDYKEGEGGDEKLEGVFEEAANKKGPCRRTVNYSEIEDKALIKAWECLLML